MHPLKRKGGQIMKCGGLAPKPNEGLMAITLEMGRTQIRVFQPQTGCGGIFTLRSVFSQPFTDQLFIARHIQNVIPDLEHQPKLFCKGHKLSALAIIAAGQDSRRFDAVANERARFAHFTQDHGLAADLVTGEKIQHLAARKSILTHGPGEFQHKIATHRCFGMCPGIAQNFESKGQQGVPRKHGSRFIESAVQRRLAAPQVVIVHAGQVIMDKRLGMHAFDGRRDAKRTTAPRPQQITDRNDKHGTETLAGTQRGIAHGICQSLVT